MARLTEEMKDLVAAQQCFVATVSPDGTPSVGPKRSTRVVDDEHIMFSEVTGKRTWANIQAGSKVAIAVVDREKLKGYRFVGTPDAVTAGPGFDSTVERLRKAGVEGLKALITVKIDHIYNLGMPGAGDEIV